ncbi:MAG: Asp23/Gls24 family envelope stress response protein [Firmicutes bacterium]|nr:Asp23/Gls24 family envelope stress response protein [Bacillota bacterium]
MAVNTANAYGRIMVTDEAISEVAGFSALDCYGIVDLVTKKFCENISQFFRKGKVRRASRGVKVLTNGDKIFIDLKVIVKYGVAIEAVAESLKKTVTYNVEKFTGMVVDTVNINVIGVKV